MFSVHRVNLNTAYLEAPFVVYIVDNSSNNFKDASKRVKHI